jgi:uncharacterized membrane protein YeaQ/YmgE (transglycosylase-associated protein family)
MGIIAWIVLGLCAGLIARAILPGTPKWLLAIAGSLLLILRSVGNGRRYREPLSG